MERELIDFIQNPKNIELLNLGQIDTLLQKCPVNLRPQLVKMLADSDITLQDSGDSMYGIQSAKTKDIWEDTYKLVVNSPNRKANPQSYGASLVRSYAVKSGSLVAFKSLKDAYQFIQMLGQSNVLSPFKMSHSRSHNWVEVPYRGDPNYKFWITETIIDYYDLDKRKYQRQLQKAYELFCNRFKKEFSDRYFISDDLAKYLQDQHFDFNFWVYNPQEYYNGVQIAYSTDSKNDIELLKEAVLEYLVQKHINNNQLILVDDNKYSGRVYVQLNDNKKLLNDIANQLNNEFGVNLQQRYPEIFS